MRFSKIFAKRFYSSPQSPLQQDIKYSLKEFLEAYEKRTTASQDAYEKRTTASQDAFERRMTASRDAFERRLDTKLELYRNDINVCSFLYKPE